MNVTVLVFYLLIERRWKPVHVTRVPYGPRLEKPCLLDFPQNDIQTSLLSYRDEQSKYGRKDQESIQSSTIPDPGYQWEL